MPCGLVIKYNDYSQAHQAAQVLRNLFINSGAHQAAQVLDG